MQDNEWFSVLLRAQCGPLCVPWPLAPVCMLCMRARADPQEGERWPGAAAQDAAEPAAHAAGELVHALS